MPVEILPSDLHVPIADVAKIQPAVPRSFLGAVWRRLVNWIARIEDSLIGDVLGVLLLFSGLLAFLWLAPLFGLFLQ
ncbi:hypothetical protein [Cereibacter johrii]|uniref:hypothetical protein n=1 Tax=Cereibacter johrii TaxID=445629 RepID=UPI000DCC607C|nr:hypothetical protein [Cereibacter johrii]RAZ84958.1 hypothetical protein DDV93_09855 [Cereibacter johrii]